MSLPFVIIESQTWRDKEDFVEGARDEEKSEQDVEAEEEIPLVGQPLNLHQHRKKDCNVSE